MTVRLRTALIILAVAVPILLIGNLPLIILGVIATTVAVYEMLNLIQSDVKTPLEVKLLTVFFTLYVMFSGFDFGTLSFNNGLFEFNIFTLCLMCVTYLIIPIYRLSFKIGSIGFYLLTIMYIGTTFHAMLYLRFLGLAYLLLVIAVAAISDSAAYFFGKQFGRRKLAPQISPNKTIEGAIGGVLSGVIVGVVFGYMTGISSNIMYLVLISLTISIVGIVGDLIASSMKRQYQIKDFGKIFPGHGGVLDRLDSHLFAALAFYLILNFVNVVN